MKTYDSFEKDIGIDFKDKSIRDRVFIHRSYLNENRDKGLVHNERLEFLGDAVLELAVTEYLFNKMNKPEGEMTALRSALVKGESLSKEAKKIGMNDLIKTSRGEANNSGKARDLILANTFEALIGAIYIDQGYAVSSKFIEEHIIYNLDLVLEKDLWYDPKSKFQEMSQEAFGITPTYELISEIGPDHNKVFEMSAQLGDVKVGKGSGQSKQKSQTEAAVDALNNWKKILKNNKITREDI
jgi:ribonuclease-3